MQSRRKASLRFKALSGGGGGYRGLKEKRTKLMTMQMRVGS